MKTSCTFAAALTFVLMVALSGASAEETSDLRRKALETFSAARDQRSKLLIEIPRLKEALEMLHRRKANVSQLQNDKRRVDEDLARWGQELQRIRQDLQTAPPVEKPQVQAKIRSIEDLQARSKLRLASIEQTLREAGQEPKKIDEELEKKQEEITQAQAKLEAAEQRINELLNFELPRQSFKLYMSGVFALLVAGVIGGFFWIAMKDERVRQAIFSGTAGIQFVTLFSVVIAIILFGIIEILEGKELAALLGGLSGYILGRATSEPTSTPQQPVPLGGSQPIQSTAAPQPPIPV
jgi:hypothetical protein